MYTAWEAWVLSQDGGKMKKVDISIDTEALKKIEAIGGRTLVAKMIDVFLIGAVDKHQKLSSLNLQEPDSMLHEIEMISHTLKSSAAYLGLNELGRQSHLVEMQSTEKKVDALQVSVPTLAATLQASVEALKQLRKAYS
ncbi:MAG: Hpt domain-containing protein [Bdellovibrionota bacterium]